jgi:spore germination protein (amino acid permease)
MKHKGIIGNYQVVLLTFTVLTTAALLKFPSTLVDVSGQDAWFSYFSGLLFAILIVFLLYKLKQREPDKNIFQIANVMAGKGIGGLLNGLLIIYLMHILIRDLRMFAHYMNTAVLQRTPLEFILMITVVILVYFGRGSVEELARANDVIAPLYLLVIISLPFLLLNEIDPRFIQPVLGFGVLRPFQAGLLQTGWFADIIVIGAFLNNVKSARGLYISLKFGIVLSAIVLTLVMVINTMVLGVHTQAEMMYPNYTMIEMIHITDFLDRLELFLVMIWMPALFMKLGLVFLAVLVGLASYADEVSINEFSLITGWLILFLTLVSVNTSTEVIDFANYGSMIMAVFSLTIYFLGVYAAVWWRKIKPVDHLSDDSRWGYYFWIAVAGCLLPLTAGSYFGPKHGMYGISSALMYGIFLLLAFYFSYKHLTKENYL